jgi:hypothetical protein
MFGSRTTSTGQMFAGGMADAALQADVWLALLIADKLAVEASEAAMVACEEREIQSVEIVEGLTAEGEWDGGEWAERWAIDRCGTPVSYTIDFSPGRDGGTDYSIRETIALPSPTSGVDQ